MSVIRHHPANMMVHSCRGIKEAGAPFKLSAIGYQLNKEQRTKNKEQFSEQRTKNKEQFSEQRTKNKEQFSEQRTKNKEQF